MPSLKPCDTAIRCAAARSTRACHSAASIALPRLVSTSLISAPFVEGRHYAAPRAARKPPSHSRVGGEKILDRAQQAAGQALLISALSEQALVDRVRETAQLDQRGWHIGRRQHREPGGAMRLFEQWHGMPELPDDRVRQGQRAVVGLPAYHVEQDRSDIAPLPPQIDAS